MSEKLKPCPFCGGEVEFYIGVYDICTVTCKNCGAMTSFTNSLTKDKTIDTWNRRVSNDN